MLEIRAIYMTFSDKNLKMCGQFHFMIGKDYRTSQPAYLEIFSASCFRPVNNNPLQFVKFPTCRLTKYANKPLSEMLS